ncbi:hypothetical protein MKY37_07850 [Psychrobacillus sp. FSL K6-2836]|uniref:hypothetical protein n=1 Tax=Psychrobacillus sp. FSL K6-2836 TaxID=2921548 RepID=UPI0030F6F49E
MLKKILIIVGIFIVGMASISLLNKSLDTDTAVANKEEQKPLFTKEELNFATLNMVAEKIHEIYEELEFGVSSNSETKLKIQVKENEEYFNSVKKDIESIAKSVIKSSALKDYTVVVERLDLSFITEEVNKELLHLTSTLMKGLKSFDVFEKINAEYQKSITIHTSIESSDKDAHKLALEIEEIVNEILLSKELNSLSYIDTYDIKILNTKGKLIK